MTPAQITKTRSAPVACYGQFYAAISANLHSMPPMKGSAWGLQRLQLIVRPHGFRRFGASQLREDTEMNRKRGRSRAIVISAFVGALSIPIAHAADIDPEADRILKSMSDYLGSAKAFSMTADIDLEVVLRDGQKLQLSASAEAMIQRPNKLYIHRRGVVANVDVVFDGETLTLNGRNLNVYAQTPVAGTIDDAILAYEMETGIPAPGADLLFADPYKVLSEGVDSSSYFGTTYIAGVECHHLAFREDNVDWQIWIRTGEQPLPMKYVITSKWHTAAPQYEVRLRDWNTSPQISAGKFDFSPADGAVRLDEMVFNELGEFSTAAGGEKQ